MSGWPSLLASSIPDRVVPELISANLPALQPPPSYTVLRLPGFYREEFDILLRSRKHIAVSIQLPLSQGIT